MVTVSFRLHLFPFEEKFCRIIYRKNGIFRAKILFLCQTIVIINYAKQLFIKRSGRFAGQFGDYTAS